MDTETAHLLKFPARGVAFLDEMLTQNSIACYKYQSTEPEYFEKTFANNWFGLKSCKAAQRNY